MRPSRRLTPFAVPLVATVALLAAGCGADEAPSAGTPPKQVAAVATPAADDPTLAPLPKGKPRVVEPVAGKSDDAPSAGDPADDLSLPKPTGPATDGGTAQRGAPGTSGHKLKATTATALDNGVALPPLEAPEAVLAVIRAGNQIARTPYVWGGGHGRFKDKGYDCSGSVSYALYSAGLIDGPYTSGGLMSYGKPGKGRWITLYANDGHVFMEVAGIRFDTSGQRVTGSRWQNEFRGTGGFVARHPAGL